MVLVFKMAVALASQEGKNDNGQFAYRWKRRISIAIRGMMYQAHYALRKHLRDDQNMLNRMMMMSTWQTSNMAALSILLIQY